MGTIHLTPNPEFPFWTPGRVQCTPSRHHDFIKKGLKTYARNAAIREKYEWLDGYHGAPQIHDEKAHIDPASPCGKRRSAAKRKGAGRHATSLPARLHQATGL